jgi:hypothetical protein
MNISEFSPNPGTSFSATDLSRLASFGFEIPFDTVYAGYLIDRVLVRLDELIPSSPKHWSRNEILSWINDAITELNLIAGYLTKTVTVTWSQSNNNILLPEGTIIALEVYYNKEVIKKYTVEELDSKLIWDDGSVGYKPKAWCPLGTQNLIVYPLAPSAGFELSVMTLYQPDAVTYEATQEIEVTPQFIDCIDHYCFARARFKEGGAEFQQAEIDYGRFFDMASQLKLRSSRQRRVDWRSKIQSRSSSVRLKDLDVRQ